MDTPSTASILMKTTFKALMGTVFMFCWYKKFCRDWSIGAELRGSTV